MNADHPLDDPCWHALTSHHSHLAEVEGTARRYPPDVSPFAAVGRVDDEGWASLAALLGRSERPPGWAALLRAEVPAPPPGWSDLGSGDADQMVVTALVAPDRAARSVALRPLTPADVPAMVELVALTEPGPFLSRTIELGGYVGAFEEGQLVAMAGERLRLPGYAEVSAVCTRPSARGRGLAAALTHHVAATVRDRGETPMLHVVVGNDGARRVYERLGFATRGRVRFTVLRPPARARA